MDTNQRIKNHMRTLKLFRMEKALDEELKQAVREKTAVSAVIERLMDIEASSLIERRIERRVKESFLPERKLLADFNFAFQKCLDKAQIMELATLSFAKRKEWIILGGSSGTGKSYIAKALLLIGCQKLYRCRYTTAHDMLQNLMASLCDGTLMQKLKVYTSPEILLIDELGFDRLEQESSRNAALFFKVIDARYCKSSTIVTTNVSYKELGDYLGDPVITTAIVDRMIHHSIIISIIGPSYRQYESDQLIRKSHRSSLRTKTG